MASKKPATETVEETAVAIPESKDVFAESESLRDLAAGNPWDELDTIDSLNTGAMLETKVRLIGVPFIITKVVYRPGAFRRAGEAMADDYVSLECITPPKDHEMWKPERIVRLRKNAVKDWDGSQIDKYQYDEEDYVGPNDFVVVNDSSTGIKRQITAYLAHKGVVVPNLETTGGELPPLTDLSGHLGENVFDQNHDEWVRGGERAVKPGYNIRLMARQGLRASAYENDFTQSGVTFYLA